MMIAIDGRCGSGKTTLSLILKELFGCTILHMDDYYLPFSKRHPDWEHIPGGNIDLERFRKEVLEPAKEEEAFLYQPYFCREDRMLEGVTIEPEELIVVEGSYCQHPDLADLYDLKIFLTCSKEEQKERLLLREGERLHFYLDRWIPMEERYYEAYDIPSAADAIFDTRNYRTYQTIARYIHTKVFGG